MSSLKLGFNLNEMIPENNFSMKGIGKSGNGKMENIGIMNGRLNWSRRILKSRNKIIDKTC